MTVIPIVPQFVPGDIAPQFAQAQGDTWVQRIAASWRQSLSGILETGRLLLAAKEALPHGTFGAMIASELPFGSRTAQILMKVAADPRLLNPNHASLLPPSWMALYEISKLDDTAFDKAIEAKVIRPDMERRDIAQVAKQQRRATCERELSAKQMALPQKKYGVILADPEWDFEPYSRETGMDRSAANHYPTSALLALSARDVASIAADDCVLFEWATAPMLPHALDVMKAWKFEYKSHYIWVKSRGDRLALGTGYWNRNAHELLLIGTKGNIPAPAPGTQQPSIITAPIGEHSAKPEVFLKMIEEYFPNLPKIELNRRGPPREGWDAWGNEAENPSAPTSEQP